ncbi:unnamed protein product [Mytilus edulis]|uniref:Uncharacterized protein n=1 Tax=Mytilus edulis TaxID=6550 RepID=A0A8S3QEL1_MYTED|nr:unnamed protein product [Mytilus edulis]
MLLSSTDKINSYPFNAHIYNRLHQLPILSCSRIKQTTSTTITTMLMYTTDLTNYQFIMLKYTTRHNNPITTMLTDHINHQRYQYHRPYQPPTLPCSRIQQTISTQTLPCSRIQQTISTTNTTTIMYTTYYTNHQHYNEHVYNKPHQLPTLSCSRIQQTSSTTNTTMITYTTVHMNNQHLHDPVYNRLHQSSTLP